MMHFDDDNYDDDDELITTCLIDNQLSAYTQFLRSWQRYFSGKVNNFIK